MNQKVLFRVSPKAKKFLAFAAVERPRWDSSRNFLFDSKIGLWLLKQNIPARRCSISRLAKSLNPEIIL